MAAAADSALDRGHEQLLALRDRMRLRKAANESIGEVTARHQDIPVVTLAEEHHVPVAVALPPADVLADLKKAQALRERVLGRGASQGQHRSETSARLSESFKDVYPHEQPFPVTAVYELDAVHTGARNNYEQRSETLLMAAESASVLRAVEHRLGDETAHRLDAQRKIVHLTSELTEMTKERDELKKAKADLTLKEKDLTAEVDKLKKQIAADAAALIKEREATVAANKKALDEGVTKETNVLREEIKVITQAKAVAELEMKTLHALVQEMREQLQTNGSALQTQTMTIRQLTEEILGARGQVTNLSVALSEKDKELRSVRADMHSLQSKSHSVLESEKDFKALKVEVEALKKKLETEAKLAATVPQLTEERDKLIKINAKLESEMQLKNHELGRLKAQVEAVRSQADAAYLHSAQFHNQAPSALGGGGAANSYGGGAGYSAGYVANGNNGAPAPNLDYLKREIEEEERRVQEEQRRWRQRQAKA